MIINYRSCFQQQPHEYFLLQTCAVLGKSDRNLVLSVHRSGCAWVPRVLHSFVQWPSPGPSSVPDYVLSSLDNIFYEGEWKMGEHDKFSWKFYRTVDTDDLQQMLFPISTTSDSPSCCTPHLPHFHYDHGWLLNFPYFDHFHNYLMFCGFHF